MIDMATAISIYDVLKKNVIKYLGKSPVIYSHLDVVIYELNLSDKLKHKCASIGNEKDSEQACIIYIINDYGELTNPMLIYTRSIEHSVVVNNFKTNVYQDLLLFMDNNGVDAYVVLRQQYPSKIFFIDKIPFNELEVFTGFKPKVCYKTLCWLVNDNLAETLKTVMIK